MEAGILVTHHAPVKEPAKANVAPAIRLLMGSRIFFEYAQDAKAVPHTDVALLFPSKLAGAESG